MLMYDFTCSLWFVHLNPVRKDFMLDLTWLIKCNLVDSYVSASYCIYEGGRTFSLLELAEYPPPPCFDIKVPLSFALYIWICWERSSICHASFIPRNLSVPFRRNFYIWADEILLPWWDNYFQSRQVLVVRENDGWEWETDNRKQTNCFFLIINQTSH